MSDFCYYYTGVQQPKVKSCKAYSEKKIFSSSGRILRINLRHRQQILYFKSTYIYIILINKYA